MNFSNNYCPNCKGICVKSIKNIKFAVGMVTSFIFAVGMVTSFMNVTIVAVVFLKQEIQ